ncbi:MAG TPA: hypothetical protein VFB60_29160 [Ktedonobacteraceae bacterium]|nr:hypothetical protein [Ktedonobacteraceae bacterium]
MMFRHKSENQTEKTASSLLQSRPQRDGRWQRPRTLSIVLLLVGVAIIVGTSIVLAVVLTPHGPAASSSTNANPPAITNKQTSGQCSQGQSLPPLYWSTLLQQTAQGLHLSVAQVKAQIKGGKSIQDVASVQGISAQLLLSIETSALQTANNQMVTLKCQTQAQANANVQSYANRGAQDMNERFTYWFTQ